MYGMLANEMKWAIDDVRSVFHLLLGSWSPTSYFIGDRENHILSHIWSSFRAYTISRKRKNPCSSILLPVGKNPHRRPTHQQRNKRSIELQKWIKKVWNDLQMESTPSTLKMISFSRYIQQLILVFVNCTLFFQSSLHSVTYPYVAPLPPLVQETRSRDAFGLDIRGRAMLIEGGADILRDLGGKMSELFGTGWYIFWMESFLDCCRISREDQQKPSEGMKKYMKRFLGLPSGDGFRSRRTGVKRREYLLILWLDSEEEDIFCEI